MNTQTNTLLEWRAPSTIAHQRSEQWYTVAGVLALMGITYGILSGAWTLSITVALLAGLFYLVRNESEVLHTISVRETGILFDRTLYLWSDLKQFWILQGEGYHELHVETTKRLSPDIVIHTADIDPYVVIDTLSHFIPQIDHRKEKVLDAIIRFCKL